MIKIVLATTAIICCITIALPITLIVFITKKSNNKSEGK